MFRRSRPGRAGAPRARSVRPARSFRRKPLFELLEDRHLLAVLTVNSALDNATGGDGMVTLREAIIAANNDTATDGGGTGAGADTIVFAPALNGQTITLGSALPTVTAALQIDASALALGITVNANNGSFRVLNFDDGNAAAITVGINKLTLVGGNVAGDGGGIRSRENLTITNSTIVGNNATSDGGGIAHQLGTLTITGSTISGNTTAEDGGGLYTNSTGAISITNSTFSANTSADHGGGLYIQNTTSAVTVTSSTISGNAAGNDGGGLYAFGLTNATVTNSTISGNTAVNDGGGVFGDMVGGETLRISYSTVTLNRSNSDSAGGGSGGGIYLDSGAGTLELSGSIIAGNIDNSGVAPDIDNTSAAVHPTISQSFTLVGNNLGSGLAASALIGTSVAPINPLLGPLANNGGLTATHALLIGSPAIDTGNPAPAAPANDQRGAGFARIVDGDGAGGARIDIGSYEFVPPPETVNVALNGLNELVISDFLVGVGGGDNVITLRRDGANLVIHALNNNINVGIGGSSGDGTNEVRVPIAAITGNRVIVDLNGGNDVLNVDSTGGLLTFANGIRFNGGTGFDQLHMLQFAGGPVLTSETLQLGATPGSGRDIIVGAGGTQTVDFESLEPFSTNVIAPLFTVTGFPGLASLLQDDNQITYTPGQNAAWGLFEIDNFEPIEFTNKVAVVLNAGSGDDVVVANNANVPTLLTSFTINAENGNDEVRLINLPIAGAGLTSFTVTGGAGNDSIDGSTLSTTLPLTLSGDAGNDTITGGAGADMILGGGNDDTLIFSPGNDTYDGSSGNDTLLTLGTIGNDVITFNQSAAGTLAITVNGFVTTNTISGLELVKADALSGDDIIGVSVADAVPALSSLPFRVIGNSPNASDRLIVNDDGLGDLTIHRLGADQRSGSVAVGDKAPVSYEAIEFVNVVPVNPITGGSGADMMGRVVVFKNDPFESNNTLATATHLGADLTINTDPTIDPGGVSLPAPFPSVPGDADFYRFVAQETGTLDFQLYFRPIGTLANGRAGLPVAGELVATFFDNDGLPVSIGASTPQNILDGSGNKIGERITLPVVRNQVYYVRIEGELPPPIVGGSGINVYNFTAIVTPAPIPQLVDLQAGSDSGRHNSDDITKITTPTFDIILDDDRIDEFMNIDLNPDTVNDDAQTLNDAGGNRIDYGVQVFNNAVSIGFAFYTGVGNTWRFTATVGDLNEGSNNFISAAVWIRDRADPTQIGRHELSDALQVTLDTVAPPISFGLPASAIDGLTASSDTGVTTVPATFADRITSDTTPTMWGRAEANTIVRLFLDRNNNGIVDLLTDTFLGQTVANPLDGNVAHPEGHWEITSVLDLNELLGLPKDGLRRLLATAEDVAGNPMPMNNQIATNVASLQIFIDTQGPQVFDPDGGGAQQAIQATGFPTFDLFDPKPSTNGYTPLINALTINIRDLPARDAAFLYRALSDDNAATPGIADGIAQTLGNYLLVGDHVGAIAIQSIVATLNPAVAGQQATGTIQLNFFAPLPDDRYTLTIRDNLVDPAGNKLDGESNAAEPQEEPTFPSGDGVPGGNFVARFTVDSRPEIGAFVSQGIQIDINGNYFWDPASGAGGDTTHRDLAFTLPAFENGAPIAGDQSPHELLVAGRFTPLGFNLVGVRLFDQLATYGNYNGVFRWLIDFDSDGVVYGNGDPDGIDDRIVNQAPIAGFNIAAAIPIAGNFDGDANNGDEIGLYYSGKWAIDTDHNYVIDTVLTGNLFGAPIVGDFDGNGTDDFAVFNNNVFSFGFNLNPFVATSIVWGFPGVLDKPVAADMDQDGIDDIGLWVPRNSAGSNRIIAEWHFLVSNDRNPADGINDRIFGTVNTLHHPFSPVPFGADLYAEFGDEMAQPIVGNFDPPVAATAASPNLAVAGDYNGDGEVDQGDYTMWKSTYGSTTNMAADGNGDGRIDAADYNVWRNAMSNPATSLASTQAGDYNGSGQVTTADYSAWKSGYGSTNLAADGNGDGHVDAADYTVWRNQLATTSNDAGAGSGGLAALFVEESTTTNESEVDNESATFFLAPTTSAGQLASGVAAESPAAWNAADDSLLLLLAGQPLSEVDEALSEYGVDARFDDEDSTDDDTALVGEAALTVAWQSWDEL